MGNRVSRIKFRCGAFSLAARRRIRGLVCCDGPFMVTERSVLLAQDYRGNGRAMALIGDVAANLVAAGIGAGALYLARDKILPVVRGRLRALPRLDGSRWQRVFEGGNVTSTLTFHQSGTLISATNERRGDGTPRTFSYIGEISGHQIVLTWRDEASAEQMLGAMVLHVSAQLNRMEGFTVYFRHSSGRVVATPCKYERCL